MSANMEIRLDDFVELDLGKTIPVPVRDYLLMVNKPSINGNVLSGDLIIRVGDLENDVGYLTEETDPTVPAWAKQPTKPSYTAEEVGAMPDTTVIPIRISQLINDTGYYVKPNGGIPLSDLVPGIIPDFSSKLDASLKGARNGLAELDSNGMVPSHQLPSYVDDVKTYPSMAFFPTIGEDDKIYVDKSTNRQYRWSGDIEVGYVPIASSLALGETAQSAYRGDRGKIAYDHAMAKGQAYNSGLYKVTVNAEGHITEAVPVAKADITDLGIPGSMPDVSGFYTKPVTGIPASDLAAGVIPTVPVTDVQVNGASILQNGIANIPMAGATPGVAIVDSNFGVAIVADGNNAGKLRTYFASDDQVQTGLNSYRPIVPVSQHISAFFGLSKAAGVDLANETVTLGTYPAEAKAAILAMLGANGNGLMILNGKLATDSASMASIKSASNSYAPIVPTHIHDAAFFGLAKAAGADMASIQNVTVGQYPQAQKTAIQSMLGVSTGAILIENVSGAAPSITALPNVRYVCGECSSLSLTPPASGSCEVIFMTGTTPTLLTVPNTVKFPAWFDYTSLESDTIYDIIITDGIYGAVMSWAR